MGTIQARSTATPAVAPERAPGSPASLRVLIAVDEPDLGITCRRYLERLGHVARLSPDPSDLVEAVRADWPDVVLLDLEFTGRPNLPALVAGRRGARPALICTGRASTAARQQALGVGAVAYLAQPFSLEQLRAAIDRAARPDPA